MNFYQKIESGLRLIAPLIKNLDCEEAKYVLYIMENRGKEDGLPDLTKFEFSGSSNSPAKAKERGFESYDQMDPAEKWKISHQYEVVFLKLLEIIAESANIERKRIPRKRPPFGVIAQLIGEPEPPPLPPEYNGENGDSDNANVEALPEEFKALLKKLEEVEAIREVERNKDTPERGGAE